MGIISNFVILEQQVQHPRALLDWRLGPLSCAKPCSSILFPRSALDRAISGSGEHTSSALALFPIDSLSEKTFSQCESVAIPVSMSCWKRQLWPWCETCMGRSRKYSSTERGSRSRSPSSQAALRPPGPLRTGRESFPSPSSSPSNASLEETRFRNGETLTMNPVVALGMK